MKYQIIITFILLLEMILGIYYSMIGMKRNAFYNYMFDFVNLYLHRGLVEAPKINLDRKRLIYETDPVFLDFLEEYVKGSFRDHRKLLRNHQTSNNISYV